MLAGFERVRYVNRGCCRFWLLARNSESLRGLDAALLGQSVTASRYVDCIAGESWSAAMALSCQIAVRAYRRQEHWLCHAKAVRTSRDGSYGCFAPKLCGRIEAVAKAVSCQSCADVSRR